MGLVFKEVSREPAIAENRTDLPCGTKFSREFNFADYEVFEFAGTHMFSQIWISEFTRGNSFSLISCAVLESNKNGRHMVVFVTLFATNFIESQQCK